MRLLITGATGFIGSRLALHARRAGIDVLATGRADIAVELERLAELRAADVPVEIGTLHDVGFVRRLVRDRTVVIHLAAAQHESHMPAAYFRSVNVDLVQQLLEECRAAAIRRFVYGSTIGVYGDAGEQQLDEQQRRAPGKSLPGDEAGGGGAGARVRVRLRYLDRAHRGDVRAGRLAAAEAVPRHRARTVLHDRPRHEPAAVHSRQRPGARPDAGGTASGARSARRSSWRAAK